MYVLTREEAIENHRELWNWVADQNKKLIGTKNSPVDKEAYFDAYGIPNSERPEWDCYVCDYALSKSDTPEDRCQICPLDWSNGGETTDDCCQNLSDSGLYEQFEVSKKFGDVESCANIAKIIANLPERIDKNEKIN